MTNAFHYDSTQRFILQVTKNRTVIDKELSQICQDYIKKISFVINRGAIPPMLENKDMII